jgi:hypothetical protein
MFSQVLSGALFISFGQTVFSNQLGPALKKYAPEVDAAELLKVGATNVRSVVSEASVSSVVEAYNSALTKVFVSNPLIMREISVCVLTLEQYLGLGASTVSFLASWGLGWSNLKTKKREDEEAANSLKEEKAADEAAATERK